MAPIQQPFSMFPLGPPFFAGGVKCPGEPPEAGARGVADAVGVELDWFVRAGGFGHVGGV